MKCHAPMHYLFVCIDYLIDFITVGTWPSIHAL